MQNVIYQDLGTIGYQNAWDYQTKCHKELVDNKLINRHLTPKSFLQNHRLLLCEHPHVYTLGKSGSMENLLLSEAELLAKGIDFFPINRGGDITYHGPGQIVGYPILDLDYFFNDVHRYVRNLEEVIIRTLADYELTGTRINGYTGVWLEDAESPLKRKICAIGVHLSRWVTLHGWAFNVNVDLPYFENIVPCGIVDEDKKVTSMARELGGNLDMEEVKSRILVHFAAVFDCIVL
jgi:lipoyl(octanoyl) transferase